MQNIKTLMNLSRYDTMFTPTTQINPIQTKAQIYAKHIFVIIL